MARDQQPNDVVAASMTKRFGPGHFSSALALDADNRVVRRLAWELEDIGPDPDDIGLPSQFEANASDYGRRIDVGNLAPGQFMYVDFGDNKPIWRVEGDGNVQVSDGTESAVSRWSPTDAQMINLDTFNPGLVPRNSPRRVDDAVEFLPAPQSILILFPESDNTEQAPRFVPPTFVPLHHARAVQQSRINLDRILVGQGRHDEAVLTTLSGSYGRTLGPEDGTKVVLGKEKSGQRVGRLFASVGVVPLPVGPQPTSVEPMGEAVMYVQTNSGSIYAIDGVGRIGDVNGLLGDKPQYVARDASGNAHIAIGARLPVVAVGQPGRRLTNLINAVAVVDGIEPHDPNVLLPVSDIADRHAGLSVAREAEQQPGERANLRLL